MALDTNRQQLNGFVSRDDAPDASLTPGKLSEQIFRVRGEVGVRNHGGLGIVANLLGKILSREDKRVCDAVIRDGLANDGAAHETSRSSNNHLHFSRYARSGPGARDLWCCVTSAFMLMSHCGED